MECAKLQATTKFLNQAGKDMSHKTHKQTWLKTFSFQNYHYNRQYIASVRKADFVCRSAYLLSLH